MSEPFQKPRRNWPKRFQDAFRGLAMGVHGQKTFTIHLTCAAVVILLAGVLRLGPTQWCLLMLCISTVLGAEMFNSALETLAKAIDTRFNPHLAEGLNIASAAVLVSAAGAVVVGLLVFGHRLVDHLH